MMLLRVRMMQMVGMRTVMVKTVLKMKMMPVKLKSLKNLEG